METYDHEEWMSWLALAARGQGGEAAASAAAGVASESAWTVRWARWRPSGVIDPRNVFPGPVDGLALAPDGWDPHGRTAVVAQDDTPARPRFWVFDAATGEVLAGPWTGAVPEFGRREPLWQDGGGRLRVWAAFDPFPAGPRLVQDQLRVGDLVVVASAGGIFAVEATEPGRFPDEFPGSRTPDDGNHGDDEDDEDDEDDWDDDDLDDLDLDDLDDELLGWAMPSPLKARTMEVVPCHVAPGQADFAASPETVFGTESIVRLPASLLPAELSDPAARHTLTVTGLPSLSAAEITLAVDPETPLPRIGDLPLYGLGDWNGGPIAVHGPTGRVYRLPGDGDWAEADLPDATPPEPDRYGDWTAGEWNVDHDAPHLMAETLDAFVRLVTTWAVVRAHFPMAYTQSELLGLRDALEDRLEAISPHAVCSWWTEGLQEIL
ncbi:SUKH-4 family immunity protein [Streptomyces sp. NPDC046716]|uniref:SUKH-4 family immunity protein n=1 Tax=Streptomyces sp. NPDC046716 TaxID=3157093 RepID=UPI0033C3A5CA